MSTSARAIVSKVLSQRMADEIWSFSYDKVLPITINAFDVSAILPSVFHMFRFGQRRGTGRFAGKFSSTGADGKRKTVTIDRVARELSERERVVGFQGEIERAILGDLLLCYCLENRRHDLGRDKQVQRVAPVHFMSSWIDLPRRVSDLRFVPEMIVAMLSDQQGETVQYEGDAGSPLFRIGADHKNNRLLVAFSDGVGSVETCGDLAGKSGRLPSDRRRDRFDERCDKVGVDQLLMIRMAEHLEVPPGRVRGRGESADISNQRPISKVAADNFAEDLRRFVQGYAGRIPRQAFVDLLESCIATGMASIIFGAVEIVFEWLENGVVPSAGNPGPAHFFVDCSSGIDHDLRNLAEHSFDDLVRRIERFPEALMTLRLTDYFVRNNRRIEKPQIPSRPYATEWLNLLGDVLHHRHEESSYLLRQVEDSGESLADELGEEYPDVVATLRKTEGELNALRCLAAGLTRLLGNQARSDVFKMLDSALSCDRPNGLAKKRVTTRRSEGRSRYRVVRSLTLTDPVLDYLVHRHLLDDSGMARTLSLSEFLDTIRDRHGFHVDVAPPHMEISNKLLQANRARLERRLRDLGLFAGVNDADAMKRLRARFTPSEAS